MNIIGIDPGKNGALVYLRKDLDKDFVVTAKMPLTGTEMDIQTLKHIIHGWNGNTHIFIEDVHAIFGSAAGATFTFGFICGAIRGVVASSGMKYTLVQPRAWQKVMYQGIPEMRKPSTKYTNKTGKKCTRRGGLKTKEMSLIAAQRLFPGVDLKASSRCTKPHDGIVDALLIAEYGRRLLT